MSQKIWLPPDWPYLSFFSTLCCSSDQSLFHQKVPYRWLSCKIFLSALWWLTCHFRFDPRRLRILPSWSQSSDCWRPIHLSLGMKNRRFGKWSSPKFPLSFPCLLGSLARIPSFQKLFALLLYRWWCLNNLMKYHLCC